MKKCIFVLFLFLFSCASTSSPTSIGVMSDVDLGNLITKTPKIEMLGEKHARTNTDEIEFYYFKYNILNSPDAIVNWKYHYVIKSGSSPEYDYSKIAKISFAQKERNDSKAFNEYKKIASSLGGDAVVDIFRKPIITDRSQVIRAYLYCGIVVKRK